MNGLYCVTCWSLSPVEESDAPVAVSIMNGYALCREHMPPHPPPLSAERIREMGAEELLELIPHLGGDAQIHNFLRRYERLYATHTPSYPDDVTP